MTLGEIKLESLRLMDISDDNVTIENLKEYENDDRYKDYLDKMTGSINRAISRMMTFKILPTKTAELKPSFGESLKQFLKFNLNKILPDFESLERIMYVHERVVPNIDYQSIVEGEILIPFRSSYIFKGIVNELPNNAKGGEAYSVDGVCYYWNGNEWEEITEQENFVVEYTPKMPYITSLTDNKEVLNIPDAMARVIPYFVKGDLYETEEPQLSAVARNVFENALQEYIAYGLTRKNRQQYVKNEFF